MKALSSDPNLSPALGLGVSLVSLHGLADEETNGLRGEVTCHRSGYLMVLYSS